MNTKKIIRKLEHIHCPMCGKICYIQLTEEQYGQMKKNELGIKPIQEALSSMDPFQREFLKTGYCPQCQEMLFCKSDWNKEAFFYDEELRSSYLSDLFFKSGCMPMNDFLKSETSLLTEHEKRALLHYIGLEEGYCVYQNNIIKVDELYTDSSSPEMPEKNAGKRRY